MNSGNLLLVGMIIPYAGPLYKTDIEQTAGGGGDTAATVDAQIAANLASRGWLACDGQKLYVKDYPQLYGVIGVIYGGGGDKIGQWFNVPDYRGRFLRGTDANAQRDPDVNGRTEPNDPTKKGGDKVGSLQLDAFQGHQHNYVMPSPPGPPGGDKGTAVIVDTKTTATTDFVKNAADGEPRVSSETRPQNIYVNFLIKAF